MTRMQKLLVIFLRLAVGWFLLYHGVKAFIDPNWSLLNVISPARTFSDFYAYIAGPGILPAITFAVKAMFIISGVLLLIGVYVRIGALFGILLMLFYYFPSLSFPYAGSEYYIIDPNLLVAIVLGYLFVARAGEFFGLGRAFRSMRH